jgi:hypothetical protein
MPRARRPASTTQPDLANSILARTSERYQAAERLRRDRGAGWMAQQASNSSDHGAVRLLIGTWDALARSVAVSGGAHDQFFAINPFDLAWEALKPAVMILRESDPQYAGEFEKLASKSRAWLKTAAGRRCRSNGKNGGKNGDKNGDDNGSGVLFL